MTMKKTTKSYGSPVPTAGAKTPSTGGQPGGVKPVKVGTGTTTLPPVKKK